MSSRVSFRAFGRGESGAAFVEAAVALPVLLIVVCGAFDFGRAFSTLADAQKSLRAATRFLATLPATAVCDPYYQQQARNLAVYGKIDPPPGTKKSLQGWHTTDIVILSPIDCTVADLGKVQIKAAIAYQAWMWQTVGLPDTITFNIEHQERWQGE